MSVNKWQLDDGSDIYLITPQQYEKLPEGVELVCIDGKKKMKGKDYIDDDTRGGFIAYGVNKKIYERIKHL